MLAGSSLDVRVALSKTLDGVSAIRAPSVHLLYLRTMNAHLDCHPDVDAALQGLPMPAAVVPSGCDEVGALVRMLGVTVRQVHTSPGIAQQASVLVAGCSSRLPDYLPDGFFERGGILITSGRSILDVPLPTGLITILPAAPPASVVLNIRDDAVLGQARKVHLEAGHIPIGVHTPGDPRVSVVATSRGGEPIVVVVRIGAGWLLHSVAHWVQLASPDDLSGGMISSVVDRNRRSHAAPAHVAAIQAMSRALILGLSTVLSGSEQ